MSERASERVSERIQSLLAILLRQAELTAVPIHVECSHVLENRLPVTNHYNV